MVSLAPFLDGVARLFPFTRQGDVGGHVGWFASFAEETFIDTWAMKRVLPFFARLA